MFGSVDSCVFCNRARIIQKTKRCLDSTLKECNSNCSPKLISLMEVKLLYVGGGVELTEEREEADKVLRTVWRACWATLDTTQHNMMQHNTHNTTVWRARWASTDTTQQNATNTHNTAQHNRALHVGPR